jgi:uncharacterized protein YdaU (DUF1376 family)
MEKAMHYYQFNIGDYASHTRHLTNLEDLAYRRLLDAYYLQEHPLNTGITTVARQINMREYETEVKAVLEEFFTLTDDGWFHQRVDKEIKHFQSKRQQASNAGKASAERRNNIRSTDVQPTNNHKPITNNQETKNSSVGTRGTRLPTDWIVSDEQKAFCIKERPDLDPMKVAENFKDYWIGVAGSKGVKKDWDATWRNWVRNEKKQFVAKQSSEPTFARIPL